MGNINLRRINKLYKSGKQKDLKKAFNFFEQEKWTLKQIIEFVIENYKTETSIADLQNMIDRRAFQLGPLHFKFVVFDDWEPLDVDTTYKLELHLGILDLKDEEIMFCVIEHIQSEDMSVVFLPNKKDTPSFTEKMDECTWKVFAGLDLQENENLYAYLNSYFIDFIDKIDKKEIVLSDWRKIN